MDFAHPDAQFTFTHPYSTGGWDDIWATFNTPRSASGNRSPFLLSGDGRSYHGTPNSDSGFAQAAQPSPSRDSLTPHIYINYDQSPVPRPTTPETVSPDRLSNTHSTRSGTLALPDTPPNGSGNNGSRPPSGAGLASPFREPLSHLLQDGPKLSGPRISRTFSAPTRLHTSAYHSSSNLTTPLGRSHSDPTYYAHPQAPAQSSLHPHWLQAPLPAHQPTGGLGISFRNSPPQPDYTSANAFSREREREPETLRPSPTESHLLSPYGSNEQANDAARMIHEWSLGLMPGGLGVPPMPVALPEETGYEAEEETPSEEIVEPSAKRRRTRPSSRRLKSLSKPQDPALPNADGTTLVQGWFLCPYRWPRDPTHSCRHLAKDANDALRHCLAVHLPQEEALRRFYERERVPVDEQAPLPLLDAGAEYVSLYCPHVACQVEKRVFHGSRAWESYCTHRDSHGLGLGLSSSEAGAGVGRAGGSMVPLLLPAGDEEVQGHSFDQPEKWIRLPAPASSSTSAALGNGRQEWWPRRVDALARTVAEKRWKRTVAVEVVRVYDSWVGRYEVTRKHGGAEQKLRIVSGKGGPLFRTI